MKCMIPDCMSIISGLSSLAKSSMTVMWILVPYNLGVDFYCEYKHTNIAIMVILVVELVEMCMVS